MKKILLSFLMVVVLFSSGLKPVLAQTTVANPWGYPKENIVKDIEGGTANLGNLMYAQTTGIASILDLAISPQKTPIKDSNGTIIGYTFEGGVTGTMERVISMMTSNQGISSKEYIADLGHNLGILPKEAYAQGTSFSGLAPILPLWQKMRDITYLFYVVIFMVVGFMLLLRKKIDPRTVITIEMSLPKLIITLILITFSYAILSFILDLANLASAVIGNLFAGEWIAKTGSGVTLQSITNNNIFLIARPISNVAAIGEAFHETIMASQSAVALLAGVAIDLIFAFAVMFITFKIFFSLLGPFVGIILAVILSPIQILLMAIPGSESNIGGFLKNFISKVAVFPVVWFMLILAAIMGSTQTVVNGQCPGMFGIHALGMECADWGSKQVDVSNMGINLIPFGAWGQTVGEIIAFGILFTIPSIAQLVQNALKVKDQTGDIASQTIRKGMSKVPFMKSLAE